MNTIEGTWRRAKTFPNPYRQKGEYIYHLAHYMLAARCRSENVDKFTEFLHIVANTDESLCPPLHHSNVTSRLQPATYPPLSKSRSITATDYDS